ncbi:MAG: flavin reductase [Clostridia bacterium]|nr:flavin reductase [Clostridia bacterium]
MDTKALFKLSYGLFVLTARDGAKDNGCIINTAVQVTSSPCRISVTVNKQNYTHDMIQRTDAFNLSVLTEEAPMKVFEHFGFQSGKNVNKFTDCESENRTGNGILYIPKYTNAVISCAVVASVDCGTHTMFIADVTETKILSNVPSVTYRYYFDHIKPKPQPKTEEKAQKGYVCKICGYVYEGEELPADFVCPICKHGAEDFEPIQ